MVAIRDNATVVLLITLFTISDEQVETCSWNYTVTELGMIIEGELPERL